MGFILVERPRRIGVFKRNDPVSKFARAVMRMIERDSPEYGEHLPQFRVMSAAVEPQIVFDADEPDQVVVRVELRGVWQR